MKSVLIRVFWTVILLPPVLFVGILLSLLFYTCFNIFIDGTILFFSLYISWMFSKTRTTNPVATVGLCFIVSIIGFSILLSSQNCARCSTPAASVKQATGNIRAQAEIYFNNNQSSYEGVCTDNNVNELKKSIEGNQIIVEQKCFGPILKFFKPDFVANSYFNCNDSMEDYAVESYLPTTHEGSEFWCVDSKGFAGSINSSIGDNLKCQ
ncbi:MAG: hypothetical protein KDD45_12450 [Bdellovibrionales bacterium]|nr:hypothetical protein [Bdellovibrionales bacterium]